MTNWKDFKVGQKVLFLGSIPEQVRWGSNTDPTDIFVKGSEYEIEFIEPHTWHTKLKLKGIEGKFNSVCFIPKEVADKSAECFSSPELPTPRKLTKEKLHQIVEDEMKQPPDFLMKFLDSLEK